MERLVAHSHVHYANASYGIHGRSGLVPSYSHSLLKHRNARLCSWTIGYLSNHLLLQFSLSKPLHRARQLTAFQSTVCLDEGIGELAKFCGAGKAVAEWTARAMGGSVPFEEALAARLLLFKPSLTTVQGFFQQRPPKISSGIDELVNKLKAKNVDV